ncbi:MAG TPA: diguanylate cyclase, partial [Rhodospirillaceae bacterium]|nr:diguanylate cyclase [Rhodospirillaceae bacterium]
MTVDQYKVSDTAKIADARSLIRHVFVRNLVLMANVGIHSFEKTGTQRIRLNVDLAVRET